MDEYGLDEWDQQQNMDLVTSLEYQKTQLEKKITDINKKRKFASKLASEEICRDYDKTQELIQKNIILEQEILKLREQDGETVSSKRQKTD